MPGVVEERVGTSPESIVFSQRAGDNALFVLNRLGGSQIIAMKNDGSGVLTATYHGANQVGYWPCGIGSSPSGEYLYVLGHFDKKLRVLETNSLISTTNNDDSSIVYTGWELLLESPNFPSNQYQISDSLSALVSSRNNDYHLALLNELAEVHLIGIDANEQPFRLFSTQIYPFSWERWSPTQTDGSIDAGPGRLQGAIGRIFGTQVEFWIYSVEEDITGEHHVLRRYNIDVSNMTNDGGVLLQNNQYNLETLLPNTQALRNNYSQRALFYHSGNFDSSLFVGNTRWIRTPMGLFSFSGYVSNDGTAAGAPLADRIIASNDETVFWGQRNDASTTNINQSLTKELFVQLEYSPGTNSFAELDTIELFDTPVMKSDFDVMFGQDGWQAAFSQPHRARVQWIQSADYQPSAAPNRHVLFGNAQ